MIGIHTLTYVILWDKMFCEGENEQRIFDIYKYLRKVIQQFLSFND